MLKSQARYRNGATHHKAITLRKLVWLDNVALASSVATRCASCGKGSLINDLHTGDLVCVEGRLVLTLLRSDGDLVPLAEILASDIILLKGTEEKD